MRTYAGFVLLGALAALLTWGCASTRWSGYGDKPIAAAERAPEEPEAYAVSSATRAARKRIEDYDLPAVSTAAERLSLYYSDLGPDKIDVSEYPPRQRYNYEVYKMACSQCHTLARSVNAPTVNRGFWELYVTGMRFHAYFSKDKKLSKEDVQAVLNFLEYDANVRKRQHRAEFEELQKELKKRFQPILREKIRRLQESKQPIILRQQQP